MSKSMSGAEFACAREYLGLTPTWVADRLGVDRRTVWKWEQGKTKLPARAVNEMAGWLERTSKAVGVATLKANGDNGFELLATTDGMDNPHGFPASWQRMLCARVAERTGREIRWMSDDEWQEATA